MDHSTFQVIVCLIFVSKIFGYPLTSKLSVATWESYYEQNDKGKGTYSFGYDIEDPATGNIQYRQEERHINGTITGSYGYVDADGLPVVVTYISDKGGYRAKIEKEGSSTQYFPNQKAFFGTTTQGNFLFRKNFI